MELLKQRIKNSWKSSMIWFNTTGLVLLSVAIAEPTVKQFLMDNNLMIVYALGNIVLRFKTTKALEDK